MPAEGRPWPSDDDDDDDDTILEEKNFSLIKKERMRKFHVEHVWIIHLSLSDMASLVNYVWKKWFHFAKLKIE